MSGQHPSKWAGARCLLAQGRAMGRGTLATSPFIPPGTGRVGAARAFSIPRGWRLDCVSAPGRAEWGFFSCGFSLVFFFPRLVGILGASLGSGCCVFVCLSVCRASCGAGGGGTRVALAGGTSQVLWWLPQGRPVVAFLSHPFMASVAPGVSTAQGCGALPGIPRGCTQRVPQGQTQP